MLNVSDLQCGYTDTPVVKGMSFNVPSGNLCALSSDRMGVVKLLFLKVV